MRFGFSGPRLLGIRPFVSFGRDDFDSLRKRPMNPVQARRMANAMLYVIEGWPGHSKIGISTNPSERLATLQTGSAFRLELAAIYVPDCETPETMRIEQDAHATLDRHRLAGEWFDVEPAIAAAAISAAAVRRGVRLAQVNETQAREVVRVLALTNSSGTRRDWYPILAAAFSVAGGIMAAYYVYLTLQRF